MRTSPLAGRRRSERGAELVEFALVFPLLLLMLAGIIDMGMYFNRYQVVTNAAREGARVAAIPGWAEADVKARVAAYVSGAGMNTAALVTTVQPVAVTAGGRTVNSVRVLVTYPYQYLMFGQILSLAGGGIAPNFTLRAAATMRSEVVAGL